MTIKELKNAVKDGDYKLPNKIIKFLQEKGRREGTQGLGKVLLSFKGDVVNQNYFIASIIVALGIVTEALQEIIDELEKKIKK